MEHVYLKYTPSFFSPTYRFFYVFMRGSDVNLGRSYAARKTPRSKCLSSSANEELRPWRYLRSWTIGISGLPGLALHTPTGPKDHLWGWPWISWDCFSPIYPHPVKWKLQIENWVCCKNGKCLFPVHVSLGLRVRSATSTHERDAWNVFVFGSKARVCSVTVELMTRIGDI